MRIVVNCFVLLGLMVFVTVLQAATAPSGANIKTSDGVSLHYLDAGCGTPIVLIPGWTMPADIFEPQINELSKRFRVVALDPRSQGDSEKTAEGNFPERHAQDIKELIDHLQLKNVVLLGWSNGVPDVLTFVKQNGTTNLSGIVLVDGLLKMNDPELSKALTGMLKMFQADRTGFNDKFVRSMYQSKPTEEYISRVKAEALKTPTNTAVVEMYNVFTIGDFTPILPTIDKPVLYICEPQLEAQGKLLQTSLPNARVEVFKSAGHALFVDDPAHFNQVVADFVESTASGTKK